MSQQRGRFAVSLCATSLDLDECCGVCSRGLEIDPNEETQLLTCPACPASDHRDVMMSDVAAEVAEVKVEAKKLARLASDAGLELPAPCRPCRSMFVRNRQQHRGCDPHRRRHRSHPAVDGTHGLIIATIQECLKLPEILTFSMTRRQALDATQRGRGPPFGPHRHAFPPAVRALNDVMSYIEVCTFLMPEDIANLNMTASSVNDSVPRTIGIGDARCCCGECWTQWDLPGDLRDTHFAVHPFRVTHVLTSYTRGAVFGTTIEFEVLADSYWWRLALSKCLFVMLTGLTPRINNLRHMPGQTGVDILRFWYSKHQRSVMMAMSDYRHVSLSALTAVVYWSSAELANVCPQALVSPASLVM